MLRVVSFANKYAVNVASKGSSWPRSAGVNDCDGAGVAAAFIDKGLRNSGFKRTFDSVFYQRFISTEHLFFIDVGDADSNWQSKFAQKFCDEVGCFKFSPSLFRAFVKLSANCNQFLYSSSIFSSFKKMKQPKAGAS